MSSMGSYFSKPLKTICTLVPIAYSIIAVGVYKFQTNLIYPSNFPTDSKTIVDTPDKYSIPFEDVTINTSDGEKLKAFVMLHDQNDPTYIPKTVLMLGPNAGNMGHSLPLAQIFYNNMGYNVVMISYRGYGKSSGQPSEKGIKIDCQAVLDYLYDHQQIRNSSVILYGRSLGGAVSIYMSSLSKGAEIIKGIVLENTFLSIIKLIPIVFPLLGPLSFLCTERWYSEKTITSIPTTIPILFLSGSNDELVPPNHIKELFEISKSSVKVFKEYPKGTHNDTCLQEGYWEDVYNFIHDEIEPVEKEQ